MLSYQHAYHAGNAADLHKHIALAETLVALTAKPRGISYLESHAGRGLYDLTGAEAQKTGEAAGGIARITPEGAFGEALAAVRAAHGEGAYPGSPLIAQALLRPQDRLTLCELHPAEHGALKSVLGGAAALHRRDGHEGLRALTPPDPRRGLALMDPSYEVKAEYAETAATALAVLKRWPQGVIMIWYPILPAARDLALTAPLETALPWLFHHRVRFTQQPERGMAGSGLLVLNSPFGLADRLEAAWCQARSVFTPA
ncbi:MAG: 23S rRNA (adenine(2030)-N(6))-methyltransferase RlmJ [Pseudomonadota bacterium]